MISSPTAASFLNQAFGLILPNPSGSLIFGTRSASGIRVRPLTADRDGAWLFFEEMQQAAGALAQPGKGILVPLVESGALVDLSRRCYLDEYDILRGNPSQTLVVLGGSEYRRFSPLKCVGEGRRISLQGLLDQGRPQQLGVQCRFASPACDVTQRQAIGIGADRSSDFTEYSLRVQRLDFLRRMLGLPQTGAAPNLPWESDEVSEEESLDLAIRLTGAIYASNPRELRKGFMLMDLEEEDRLQSVGSFLPVSRWHTLRFEDDGEPIVTDLQGTRVAPPISASPNRVIISMAAETVGGAKKTALAVGWSRHGFRIEQRRGARSRRPVFSKVKEAISLGLAQVEADLAAFEELPYHDRLGWLGAYFSLLSGEKRGQS
jgi:hypothetical protein